MKTMLHVIIWCLISPIALAENGTSRKERIETNYKLDNSSIFLIVSNKSSLPMTVFNPLLENNITKERLKSQAIAGVIVPNGQGAFLIGSLDEIIKMKQIRNQESKDVVIKITNSDNNVCGTSAQAGYARSRTCEVRLVSAYLKFSFPDGRSYSGTDDFKIGFIKEQSFKIQ